MNSSENILNLSDDLTLLVLKGLRSVYRHDFTTARSLFLTIEEDTVSNFFLAMLTYTQCKWDVSNRYERDKRFEELKGYCDLVISNSSKILNDDPVNQKALFLIGGAYGFVALYYLNIKNYKKSYYLGKKGFSYLKKLIELNPSAYDAYLGIAIFEYNVYTMKAKYKFLSILDKIINVFNEDSWKKHADLVVEKGKFAVDESLLFLTQTFYSLKQYRQGIKYAEGLSSRYPPILYVKHLLLLYYQQLGNLTGFKKEYEIALEICYAREIPDSVKYIKNFTVIFARLYLDLKMNKEAILLLNNYLNKYEYDEVQNWYLLKLLALAYEQVDISMAIRTYKKILNILPENSIRYMQIKKRIISISSKTK